MSLIEIISLDSQLENRVVLAPRLNGNFGILKSGADAAESEVKKLEANKLDADGSNITSESRQIATGIVGGLGGAGIAGAVNRFGVGAARNFIGRGALREALEDAAAGRAVRDVDFGHVTRQQMDEINRIPGLAENAIMRDGRLVIPAENVKHIYNNRINRDGLSSDEVVNLLQNTMHGRSRISGGGNPYSAMMSYPENPTGYSILLPNANNTGINQVDNVIRTKNANQLANRIERNSSGLGGRNLPPSTTQENFRSMRFSARQPADGSIVPQTDGIVNRNLISGLADNNKTKTLINSVQAGNENIAQQSSVLNEAFQKRRMTGFMDPEIKESIKLPQTRKAEINYENFMNTNRDMRLLEQSLFGSCLD
ncbi:MAG: hypothetical protein FWG80_04255 [Alphaproteobacteria bacterium]|nr:hypothetical protein [Alphaproteobacteria bacterium]